jgi:DNA polymerase-3 subunit delta'
MNFWEGIYGQTAAKTVLTKLLRAERKPQALLFTGPDGVGKDFLAIRYANLLDDPVATGEGEALFEPETFRDHNRLDEPRVKFVFPMPLGKNETADDGPYDKLAKDDLEAIREALETKRRNPYYQIDLPRANIVKLSSVRDVNRFLSMAAVGVRRRSIVVSDAHKMNEQAQNALLKNLEEPPERSAFLITADKASSLRETIVSRCWTIQCEPLADEDVENILVEYFDADTETARAVAPFARGSTQDALRFLDKDVAAVKERVVVILRHAFARKFNTALAEIAEMTKEFEKETIPLLVRLVALWLNDVERYRRGRSDYFFIEHAETLKKFNARFPDVRFDEAIARMEEIVEGVERRNVNPNVATHNIVLEIAAIVRPEMKAALVLDPTRG